MASDSASVAPAASRLAANPVQYQSPPPVVWNGKVYVATYDGLVDVYSP
jgi:hypothetical protein